MANSSTKNPAKIYSLLSIGQRGVGKTVFLIGSCIELYTNQYEDNGQQLWFDCEDPEVQQMLENILRQVAQTGQYPPATMKITNFDFSLKQRNIWGTKTLCQFRWWDPPGESCQIYNPAFLMMILNSDGYCAFLDAKAIVDRAANPNPNVQVETFEPIKSIADILHSNKLYHPLAIVLTKCDLVRERSSDWQTLERSLQPLRNLLERLNVNYQIFYSAIPIVEIEYTTSLKTSETAAPILWLVSKLRNNDNLSASGDLMNPVT
jgi:GTPase SAR1 family protein